MEGAKFVLEKDENGKFRFTLVTGNGHVVATSRLYDTKKSAVNGIKSVRGNAPDAGIEDLT
ncbi:MAG: DUF1508 domain-containing protein [Pseudonocardiaceae bacterium]|nr:DUF1508 domain-containing protein [Pseudonocardiaceae bacterium]